MESEDQLLDDVKIREHNLGASSRNLNDRIRDLKIDTSLEVIHTHETLQNKTIQM